MGRCPVTSANDLAYVCESCGKSAVGAKFTWPKSSESTAATYQSWKEAKSSLVCETLNSLQNGFGITVDALLRGLARS